MRLGADVTVEVLHLDDLAVRFSNVVRISDRRGPAPRFRGRGSGHCERCTSTDTL